MTTTEGSMKLLRLALAVLFVSFTLWAQFPGSNQEASMPPQALVDASSFSLCLLSQGLFQATPVGQAPPMPGDGEIDGPSPAEEAAFRYVTASSLFPGDAAFPLSGSPAALTQTTPARPKAFTYSDAYFVRRKIHKYASFATLPLFIGETIVGQELYNGNGSESLRGTHSGLAAGIAVLFAANTVTGVWNLVEASKDPNGRTKRLVHGILMLCADAGFVATGALAPDDDEGYGGSSGSGPSTHRTVALISMGIATVGYLYMLFAN
jgi:hypothetical protein